jgi:hypothetical protein
VCLKFSGEKMIKCYHENQLCASLTEYLKDSVTRWLLNYKTMEWYIRPTPMVATPFFSFKIPSRVSCETSFDSKQPKLEPTLVSTLSETRRLFRLFRLNIETRRFDVSVEPKQTENNRNKQEKVLKPVYF